MSLLRSVIINKFFVFSLVLVSLAILTACGGAPASTGWSGAALNPTNSAVYFGGSDAKIFALDSAGGAFKWVYPTDKGVTAVYGTPVVANDTIIVGGYDGIMRGIDANTGGQRWQFPVDANLAVYGPIVPTPLVANGMVYYGDNTHNFYALDVSNGAKKWQFAAQNKIWSSAAFDNGTVFFGSLDHNVYALDANTGAQKWTYDAGGMVAGSPLVVNGTLYIGALNKLIALDTTTGKPKWEFKSDNPNEWIWAHPAADNQGIYFGTLTGKVYALRLADGSVLWSLPLTSEAQIRSGMVLDSETGYFGASDQNMYAVNLSNGQLKWKSVDKALAGPIYATPVLQDGVLYIPVQGHNMYALNASDGTRKWCFDGNSRQACGN